MLTTDRPVELELGPANGAFLLERLATDPELRIFGLELRKKSATLADEKIHAIGQQYRARVFAEDARVALPRLPTACVSRIYVHFPDPWWKKRHQKRILLQPELCDEAARVLCDGGELFVQTDVEERAEAYQRTLGAHAEFRPLEGSNGDEDPGFGARSSRERRALHDGLPIVRLRFARVAREASEQRGSSSVPLF